VRLRERMRQREGLSVSSRSKSPCIQNLPTGSNGWQERIESRQREADELQEMEAHQKMITDERSSRRNDALRKVMERQAQRQQAVEGLEEGLPL
jgi:hypothetical protein